MDFMNLIDFIDFRFVKPTNRHIDLIDLMDFK